ncbi:MAG: transcriptional regulator, partial [Gemmatimonadetes bacterium]|nr:transcriptional regulator [Gemmatimonadota bacterium]
RLLGEPRAVLDGRPLRLTLRQFEILAILAVRGEATLGDLHADLYGDRPVTLATLKAEMSHLRSTLRGGLGSRPYRLTMPTTVDALRLLHRVDTGDADGAARLYRGQLLPRSEAPFV